MDVVHPHQNFYADDVLVHNRFVPSPCCFKGSTQVQLVSGEHKSIKDIEIGEEVLTYNVDTSEYETGEVTYTTQQNFQTMYQEMNQLGRRNGILVYKWKYRCPFYT